MATTWDHPTLGRFTYGDEGGWTRLVDVPAFKAFSYDTGDPDAPRSTGRHKLVCFTAGPDDVLAAADVAVGEAVLANQEPLVGVVARALWENFNGRGPGSGVYGDLAAIAKAFKSGKLPPPTKAEDLLPALQLHKICVPRRFPRDERLLAELCFHAAFEEEHGASVLTDGQSVVGIGFNLDVLPFGWKLETRRLPGSR